MYVFVFILSLKSNSKETFLQTLLDPFGVVVSELKHRQTDTDSTQYVIAVRTRGGRPVRARAVTALVMIYNNL